MVQSSQNQELISRFIRFYRDYYRDEISLLAQHYPGEHRSLHVDYGDLYEFDSKLAEDFLAKPDQLMEFAEEALRVYDLPADVSLGQAHVRLQNLPEIESTDISSITVQDNRIGRMIAVSGGVRETTDVQPKITEAAFECQHCGTLTYMPQDGGDVRDPHNCQGCERQGPFQIKYEHSEMVDAQTLTVVSTTAASGETVQNAPIDSHPSIRVHVEDDLAGAYANGDFVTVTGVLQIEDRAPHQQGTASVELALNGVSVVRGENEFSKEWAETSTATVDEEALGRFAERSATILATQDDRLDEWTTQMKIVTPFLEVLGWNVYAPHVVAEESATGLSDNKADYVLYDADDAPAIVVEAKQPGRPLDSDVEQLRKYLRLFEVDRGILTNGERFRFYFRQQDRQPGEVLYVEAAVGNLLSRSEKLHPFTPAGVGVDDIDAVLQDSSSDRDGS